MKINVKHIATLANLSLSKKEEETFAKQLEAILTHIEKLAEIDTKEIKETHAVTGLTNIDREDATTESLSQDEAIRNAKMAHNGFFTVPVILAEAIEE
jgi:aspartyl-tRNA(Asn)/glutamyl-tRNA(Gln) amidotransferase subunit C